MSLRCRKCGTSFNLHHELVINNDEHGYRCKSCLTIHSWIDGSAKVTSFNAYNLKIGSKKKGGEKK